MATQSHFTREVAGDKIIFNVSPSRNGEVFYFFSYLFFGGLPGICGLALLFNASPWGLLFFLPVLWWHGRITKVRKFNAPHRITVTTDRLTDEQFQPGDQTVVRHFEREDIADLFGYTSHLTLKGGTTTIGGGTGLVGAAAAMGAATQQAFSNFDTNLNNAVRTHTHMRAGSSVMIRRRSSSERIVLVGSISGETADDLVMDIVEAFNQLDT